MIVTYLCKQTFLSKHLRFQASFHNVPTRCPQISVHPNGFLSIQEMVKGSLAQIHHRSEEHHLALDIDTTHHSAQQESEYWTENFSVSIDGARPKQLAMATYLVQVNKVCHTRCDG